MEAIPMGKVRVRKETGRLYLDFYCQGIRCHEQTMLNDTATNRKQLDQLMQRIEAKIILGEFDYAEFFPNSTNIAKVGRSLQAKDYHRNIQFTATIEDAIEAPLFSEFVEQWFTEKSVEWRNSHIRNVRSLLDSALLPTVGKQ